MRPAQSSTSVRDREPRLGLHLVPQRGVAGQAVGAGEGMGDSIFAARGTSLVDPTDMVSARVGRIMWKYESMAYALMLKHVGVLYQTMYLAATAMGLAPCALGSGDAEAFAEATGRDPWEECSVGEFMLGSRRAEPQVWELGR